MNTIIQNQRKERDELLARPYLVRKSNTDTAVLLANPMIKLITGPRRVGKSTYALLMLQGRNFAYLNFDNNLLLSGWDEELVMRTLDEVYPNYEYLLLDEVQNLKDWDIWISKLYRRGKNLVITGSNAKMLSGELATYLSGRYVEIHIQSLNYSEFLLFHGLPDTDDTFLKYLTWGGLPQLAHIGLDNRQMLTDYLGDIYNTVIMKDVISRESIRNVRFLTDLVRFVGDNIGKNISANSIRKFMLSQNITISPTLTSNYLSYLCNAYIIDQVRRFDVRGKRVFETNEKYYFEDIGLRNVLVGSNLRMDIEKLLENVVYLHLRSQGYQVTVGQLQNGEVDFVAERGGDRVYVQVTYLLATQETMDREFGNLRRIKDDYPKKVVCMDALAAEGNYEGIECVHVREFLKGQ